MDDSVRSETAAIAAGDTASFSRFYERWFDVALREAIRVTGRDEQFCLDVVQESMMRVIRSIRPMAGESDVKRWLAAVVRSCAYDQLRRDGRRLRREHAAARAESQSPPATDLDERLAWLRAQLAALPAGEAAMLSMRFRLGWTLARIGQALGLKPGAVDGRMSRTLQTLRRAAQEDGDDA